MFPERLRDVLPEIGPWPASEKRAHQVAFPSADLQENGGVRGEAVPLQFLQAGRRQVGSVMLGSARESASMIGTKSCIASRSTTANEGA